MAARFYHPTECWAQDQLTGEEARHAIKVLRVRRGERIELFDGQGRVAQITVTDVQGKILCFQREAETLHPAPATAVTLYQAVTKGKSMDLIIQKAVELGVLQIQPLYTANTVAVSEAAQKKADKWQRLALEAAKQCKQPWLPTVHPPVSINEVSWAGDLRLIASLRENAAPLRSVLESALPLPSVVALLVGPEGDFTDAELTGAEQAGFLPVSLGALTLRSETATLYSLAAIQLFWHYP